MTGSGTDVVTKVVDTVIVEVLVTGAGTDVETIVEIATLVETLVVVVLDLLVIVEVIVGPCAACFMLAYRRIATKPLCLDSDI